MGCLPRSSPLSHSALRRSARVAWLQGRAPVRRRLPCPKDRACRAIAQCLAFATFQAISNPSPHFHQAVRSLRVRASHPQPQMALARLGYHAVRARPATSSASQHLSRSAQPSWHWAQSTPPRCRIVAPPPATILQRCGYRHMAGQESTPDPSSKPSNPPAQPAEATQSAKPAKPASQPPPADDPLRLSSSAVQTAEQQRKTDWKIVKRLIGHVWPKGDTGAKTRVILALALLVGGKVSAAASPLRLRLTLSPLAHSLASQCASTLLLQEYHRSINRGPGQAAGLWRPESRLVYCGIGHLGVRCCSHWGGPLL